MQLREMLIGDLTRLRYVDRFSTCHKVHRENVAEHTFYVTMYAMLICQQINDDRMLAGRSERIDMCTVMQKAMMHDIEECITGDINRLFKHSSDALQAAIDYSSGNAVITLARKLEIDPGTFYRKWKFAKDESYEGKLVKFCDYLAVLAYMVQELTHANITMREHWATMQEYHTLFEDDETFDFIREYVNDAKEILHAAFAEAKR